MNIGKFSIKNKYFILALAIGIVLIGTYSKLTLKTQLAPDTNAPTATVMAQYPGASAQDVVKDVVEPMEDEFGKLEGISRVESTSQDNMAIISLEFGYDIDIDASAIDIQNAISRIRNNLPDNMNEPKVLKFSTSDKPIMTLGLKSDSVDMRTIRQIAEDEIGFDLQLVEGIASIDVFGGYNSLVKVDIDKNKLISYGLSLDEVSRILAQDNVNAPGGKLIDDNKEILIRIEEGFGSIDDLERLKIPLKDGNSIYLEDIANIDLSIEDLESSYKLNGEEAISILVTKRSDANTVEVVDNTKAAIKELDKKYPFIEIEIAQDDSVFTNQMVNNMTSSVFFSMALTIIIIMLFISNVGQSIVVAMSMPLVFLTTLGIMKLTGMSLDMVTLSALILSIGFVVDSSVIVVENIMSHSEGKGKDITTATIDATNQIALPSIAGATTTLVVLIPLIFVKGFVGEMFRPLSFTLIYAISASIIIALIVIPLFTVMMSRLKFNKINKLVEKASRPFNKIMDKILGFYVKTLKISLKNKGKVLLITLILMILSGLFLRNNGLEMLPKFDSGVTFVSLEMEAGTSLEQTTNTVEEIEKLLAKEENVESYDTQIGFEKDSNLLSDFGVMGTNQALMTINLNTRKEREQTIWEFQEDLRKNIKQLPGVQRFVVKEQGGTATTSSKAPIDLKISGQDQEILYSIADDLQNKISEIEGTTNLYKSFNIDNLQLNVKIDSARSQELGLLNAAVARQIFTSIEGIVGTNMDIEGMKNVDVSVQYMDEYKESIDNLLDVYIDTPMGVKVPLREVATVEINKRANIITKEDFQFTINVLGYTHTRAFSHITKDINTLIENYPLPSGYSAELAGEQRELSNSMSDMIFLLALAIVFVYLVLVPQFKSFLHPIIIMVTIPLSVIGVAPALGLTGKYMSMPVLLGFILLAGTVINDAILLLDVITLKRDEGLEINDAIEVAVKSRYRPIMMTSLSDITGMLPLAMQLALGSERFSPLAIAVSGGMIATTFLAMIIVPVIYASFEGLKEKIFNQIVPKSEMN